MSKLQRLRLRTSPDERASWILFAACWIAYMTIGLSKFAFSAAIAPIVQENIFTKTQAGIISGAYYLFYGGAQLVGIKIIDRISPVKFIILALAGTVLCCIGISLSSSFVAILALWSLCGVLQFATWPATLRIISEYLLPEHKPRAMMFISFALCAGTLVNYLIAAVVLSFAGWSMIFIVVSVLCLAVLVLWLAAVRKSLPHLEPLRAKTVKPAAEEKKADVKMLPLILSSGALFLLLPSFVRTALDTGVKAWVPTMISESYAVSASFSNILTMVMVFVNLGGVFIAAWMYPKIIRNAVGAFGACFLAAFPMAMLLLLIGKIPLAAVVLLLVALTTMMYTGYQLNYVIIPAEFAYCGRSGSIASLLNAVASFGAVAANFGFGYLAEHTGWTGTIISWVIMAAAAALSCLAGARVWGKFIKFKQYTPK